MGKTIRDIWTRREIVRHFVSMLLTTSYRTKTFGFLWALLDPLLFMCVYYLVFGYLIRHRPLPFILHIYVGVIAFRFLNTASAQSSGMLRGQSGLIREIAFPKAALPVSVMVARLFDLAAGWAMAVLIGCAFQIYPNGYWLLIPVVMVIQVLFVTGVCLITAYVGVFFADIQNILDVGLRLWFYLSPVLYTLSDIRDTTTDYVYQIYLLNPMTSIVEMYQALVMGDLVSKGVGEAAVTVVTGSHLPDWHFVVRAAVAAVVTFVIGLRVFARGEGQIAKYV